MPAPTAADPPHDPAPGPLEGRRCAVLGSPVGHSLSPVLHRAAYAALGLDWTYEAVETREDQLAGFLDGLDRSWRGLSLTMPLKRTVMPLLDEVSPRARLAGGANTVVLDGGRRRGDNTDLPGAVAALRERWDGPVRRATVLGGGATATSLLLALTELGCTEATLVVRDPARAGETLETVARHPAAPVVTVSLLGGPVPVPGDVVVSTVPAAAQDRWVLGLAEHASVVFEAVYDPWPTPLAAAASAAGQTLVGGLDLLVHQAVLQLALMVGPLLGSALEESASLAVMRQAGEAALAGRQAHADTD